MGAKTASGRAVDGVILPVSPHAATQEGTDRYFGYTASQVEGLYLTLSQTSASHVRSAPRKIQTDRVILVSVDHSQRLPVGLQVMCWRLQEEKVLALVQVIKEALIQTYDHSGS
ncbi:hypothetical protein E4T50_15050 [Aureobasidium sp. EXF-12298]|nr:hypothetical protein E4T50_15050 [Aureobasidium sp. EXF-12298]